MEYKDQIKLHILSHENKKYPMGVLHTVSIKNNFMIKWTKAFLFLCDNLENFHAVYRGEPSFFVMVIRRCIFLNNILDSSW